MTSLPGYYSLHRPGAGVTAGVHSAVYTVTPRPISSATSHLPARSNSTDVTTRQVERPVAPNATKATTTTAAHGSRLPRMSAVSKQEESPKPRSNKRLAPLAKKQYSGNPPAVRVRCAEVRNVGIPRSDVQDRVDDIKDSVEQHNRGSMLGRQNMGSIDRLHDGAGLCGSGALEQPSSGLLVEIGGAAGRSSSVGANRRSIRKKLGEAFGHSRSYSYNFYDDSTVKTGPSECEHQKQGSSRVGGAGTTLRQLHISHSPSKSTNTSDSSCGTTRPVPVASTSSQQLPGCALPPLSGNKGKRVRANKDHLSLKEKFERTFLKSKPKTYTISSPSAANYDDASSVIYDVSTPINRSRTLDGKISSPSQKSLKERIQMAFARHQRPRSYHDDQDSKTKRTSSTSYDFSR